MGRIKTSLVKRITKELYARHKAELTTDFAFNKAIVAKYIMGTSPKLKNVIAGYATRLTRKKVE